MRTRLQRLIQIQPTEVVAVGWSWLFFFSVLTSYYVIRPIRVCSRSAANSGVQTT